ncbi:MAG TPA: hypothetical protein VFU81_23405 [Thermomicrobiales bacterium]|nr:hypothetical protein [Thermomicrobiales bacterium]
MTAENNDNPIAEDPSPDDCELSEQERQRRLDAFREAVERIGERNKALDPDEELAFITEIVEEVRQEQYERERAEPKNSH